MKKGRKQNEKVHRIASFPDDVSGHVRRMRQQGYHRHRRYASAIGGENFAVVEGGNVDGAISFLTYMMDETVMTELLASFGYIAGIDAIAQNQFTGDEDYLKFVEQMTYAKARGPHENWPSISDAISLAFNQVMTDAATPADAAATAQATIDSVLN